jgi:hypothetical protein
MLSEVSLESYGVLAVFAFFLDLLEVSSSLRWRRMMASSFCWTSFNRRGGSTPGKFRSTCSSTISTSARSSAIDKSVFIL